MELTVDVHHERGGYWCEVAELPGCFASGRTLGELQDALAESIGLYLWDLPARSVDPQPRVGRSRIEIARDARC